MLGLVEIHWHHWYAGKLVEVKVRLERQDLAAIDQQASAAGTNQLLRNINRAFMG